MRAPSLLVLASIPWWSPALADPPDAGSPPPVLPYVVPPSTSAAPSASAAPPSSPVTTEPAETTETAQPLPPSTPSQEAPPAEERVTARDPFIHRGFYLRVSSDIADVTVTGSAPGGGSASLSGLGSRFALDIGGSPAPGLAIGFDLQGATVTGTFNGGPQVVATTTFAAQSPQSPTTETLSGHAQGTSAILGGFVDWFPNPEQGWHVGATLGLGVAGIRDDAYHPNSSVGFGLGASGGYEWWLARGLSAGLEAFVIGTLSGDAKDDHGNDTGYRLGSVSFGLGGELLYY